LRSAVAGDDDVAVRDVSAEFATIGLWGPAARDILGDASPDDTTDAALPARQARAIRIGGAQVLASRISYAGELGWELTAEAASGVTMWDGIRAAGRDRGLDLLGYRALDALRMEKGYRYFGTDMTMLDTPDEAGLGAFVRPDKGDFIGRSALVDGRADRSTDRRRLRTVLIGDRPGYLPIYGGEAVRSQGDVVGRLRSVAYGVTLSRTIGYVYLATGTEEGAPLVVDVFDQQAPAVVAADVVFDPRGDRMRG
jgi:glycine cleavage system aminomethyltransferase T